MSYTLWFGERLVGTTDLDRKGPGPSQRLGLLQPTEFGLTLMPRFVGMLQAMAALNRLIEHRGAGECASRDAALAEKLAGTSEGQRVVALARELAQLELRDPAGHPLNVSYMAISDVPELRGLCKDLGLVEDAAVEVAAAVGPHYVISATLNGLRQQESRPRVTLPRMRPGWIS